MVATRLKIRIFLLLIMASVPAALSGYSVLSHEALIDTVWRPVMAPLLLSRFPGTTPAQLQEAHAYAYGGCVIQDMGYYPFGNHFFSNLTHYVRGADFIEALLRDAQNPDEFAFALGALSHYAADNVGHPLAINLSVPDLYPKLRREYGPRVTYEDDPQAHIMVEFSFDVVQIAGAGYLPKTYHNFIGFKVPRALVQRAFMQTYGLNFGSLFFWEDFSLGVYKLGASEVVPRLTQIAWKKKRKKILRLYPSILHHRLVYRLAPENYQRPPSSRAPRFYRRWKGSLKFRTEDVQLTLMARAIVLLFELLPKVGRLQTLEFKPPTPQTQALFISSFADTIRRYESLLAEVTSNDLALENRNFDTGRPVRAGDYALADKTYATLLKKLASRHFATLTPELRANILTFYQNLNAPIATKKSPRRWRSVLRELSALHASGAGEQAVAAGAQ
ncbi:MAG: zinc dependent phospholipase C family protein [Terriglobia bacterium]